MELTKKSYKRMVIDAAHKLIPPVLFLIALLAAIMCMTVLLGCSSSDDGANLQPLETSETGDVMGSVKDENGNPYPNTLVKLSSNTTSIETKTDTNGNFVLDKKDVGAYIIALTLPLSTELLPGNPASVNIQTDKTTTVDFVIQPMQVKASLNFGNVQLLEEIKDKNGNTPTNPNEPLFAANIFDDPLGLLTEIKAPDGHQVTLAEYQMAKGNLLVHCNGNTSTVEIALEGMIPNGTYTFWLAYLNKKRSVGEPIDFMNDFVYPTNPPVGSANGTENIVVADANGNINETLGHSSCVLTDQAALVIPILYHINGKTFGGGHVPDPEEVVQMLAYFQ